MPSSQTTSLISVVMPAFNAQAFIAEAIDSVMAQTYKKWELIIINDGATDETLNIANSYAKKDSRIQVLSQTNQGVSVARNAGIDHAKGQYIAFIDSDDYYQPTFLEKLYNRISEGNCDISYCGIRHEKDGNIQGAPYPEENMLLSYARGVVDYIGFTSMLIEANFLREHKIYFPVGCTVGEDQEFVMHCAIYARVKSVPEVLYHYRWNEDSVISTMTPEKVHIDLSSRQRSTQLVQKLYQGLEKDMIIRFLESWEDRIVIIFANIVVQHIKKDDVDFALDEVQRFGKIPYCWRSQNIKHFRRALILNTQNTSLWHFLWGKK